MAIIKPVKPDSELPNTWGGTQYPYTEEQIADGLPEAIPTIIDGGTLNYEKKGVFERIEYLTEIADVVAGIPIGKTLTSDSNNRFDYISPSFPEQEGAKGKVLKTDGQNPYWGDVAKKVSVLPVEPEEGILYCIPEV